MQSCTNSAEKPATQGTHRCRGKSLFFPNEGSRNPLATAGAPKSVDCISLNLSRGRDWGALPEFGAKISLDILLTFPRLAKIKRIFAQQNNSKQIAKQPFSLVDGLDAPC